MAEVKVDKELYERIIRKIQEGENRFDFPTAKSFVDKAILKMLDDDPDIKCRHYNGDGYCYTIETKDGTDYIDVDLLLCDQCHLNLAVKLLGQLAVASFIK